MKYLNGKKTLKDLFDGDIYEVRDWFYGTGGPLNIEKQKISAYTHFILCITVVYKKHNYLKKK